MVGPSSNSARRRGCDNANQHQRPGEDQLDRPSQTRLVDRRLMRNERRDCNNEWDLRGKEDSLEELFKPIVKLPLESDSPSVWKKQMVLVEGQLRQWYQLKDTPDLPTKTVEIWDRIVPYTDSLQMSAAQIFVCDTKYYVTNELDVRVWKYGIYQFIALLRNLPPDFKQKKLITRAYKDVFDNGLNHIKYLLVHATGVLKVDLDPIFKRINFIRGSNRVEELTAEENLVYRLFISIGDVYRYLFDLNRNSRDARLALDMYNAARLCDTERSRSYNQLALMSKTNKDIIGTVYNFTRAWSSVSPANGAREQLLNIYDDLYKKFNSSRMEFWYNWCQFTEKVLNGSERKLREEVWYFTNIPKTQNLSTPKLPPERNQYLANASYEEIFSKFSLALGHFLGILYTKIGTEALETLGKEVVIYFEGLVISKGRIKFGFLMEVFGLLIFMTDHLTPPNENMKDPGINAQILHMRDIATEVTLSLLVIVSEKLLQILKNLDWENSLLPSLSAVLFVWCRWAKRRQYMCAHLYYHWIFPINPQKVITEQKDYVMNFLVAFFRLQSELSVLFQRHSSLLFPRIFVKTETNDAMCKVALGTLPEQLHLDRFGDLIFPGDFNTEAMYYDGRLTKIKAQVHFRLVSILKFSIKLLGDQKRSEAIIRKSNLEVNKPLVNDLVGKEFDVLHFINKSLMNANKGTEGVKVKYVRPDSNNARVIIKRVAIKDTDQVDDVRSRLKYKKATITKLHELWSNLCLRGVRAKLVITPLRVILDTNCLIRQIHWIEQLIKVLRHPIIVPSTVLLELRGLMKGARTGYSPKPNQKLMSSDEKQSKTIEIIELGKMCIAALEFLNENKKYFKVHTICGREIKMFNYMKQKVYDEDMGPGVRNDEKILELCAHLEEKDVRGRQLDTPLCLHRNTVLLTGDRALRVRAFSQETPARDIKSFTWWALQSHAAGQNN